jgi:hypothetical protein
MMYTAIGLWLTVVAAVAVIGLLLGIRVTAAMMFLALVVASIPVAIFLKLVPRGDQPESVAQLLKSRP